jgi:hypothetical protein
MSDAFDEAQEAKLEAYVLNLKAERDALRVEVERLQRMAGDPLDPPLPGPGAEEHGSGVHCHRHELTHVTTSCLAQASSRRMSSSDGSA